MKYLAAVILYNPDQSVFQRINQYAESFEHVVVYDNTENPSYRLNFDSKKIVFLGDGINNGLSIAYNSVLKYIFDNGLDCEYMCMLDQDSEYDAVAIANMKNFIAKSQLENVAIYAPAIQYRFYTNKTDDEYKYVPWAITSGSFVDLRILKEQNLRFDENYFIDRFEVDMCKQLTNLNYRIVQVNNSVLVQELGEDSGHKHPNHSALRHYYLARNRLYFNKKFYGFVKRWILNILQSSRHIALIALYEKNVAEKNKACVRGWVDYYRSKFKKV